MIMKKFLLTCLLFSLATLTVVADGGDPSTPIPLGIGGGSSGPSNGNDPIPRSPILFPSVSLADHTLYFNSTIPDYYLLVLDEDGYVVYSTYVPSGTTLINLPTTLSGEFEIRLVTSSFYFYGYITL